MDPVQALAILSLGAFVAVLISAIFYAVTVRPRLLEVPQLAEQQVLDKRLADELRAQRDSIEELNASLAHHTAQLSAAAAGESHSGAYDDLRGVLYSQTDAVETITALLHDHADRLTGIDAQLTRQGERLARLETQLAAPVQPQESPQQTAQQLQAQADRLLTISQRLDEWGRARTEQDARLAEHARILAELDRELAAQAAAVQQLDGQVSEHTELLHRAAEERAEQKNLLQKLLAQFNELFPLVERLKAPGPRPGQDRLTDIKGIGPVYSGRLYEGGIYTFKQLAAMTPDEVKNLIGRNIDAEDWIAQAQLFASQREKVESFS